MKKIIQIFPALVILLLLTGNTYGQTVCCFFDNINNEYVTVVKKNCTNSSYLTANTERFTYGCNFEIRVNGVMVSGFYASDTKTFTRGCSTTCKSANFSLGLLMECNNYTYSQNVYVDGKNCAPPPPPNPTPEDDPYYCPPGTPCK